MITRFITVLSLHDHPRNLSFWSDRLTEIFISCLWSYSRLFIHRWACRVTLSPLFLFIALTVVRDNFPNWAILGHGKTLCLVSTFLILDIQPRVDALFHSIGWHGEWPNPNLDRIDLLMLQWLLALHRIDIEFSIRLPFSRLLLRYLRLLCFAGYILGEKWFYERLSHVGIALHRNRAEHLVQHTCIGLWRINHLVILSNLLSTLPNVWL